VWWKLSAYFPSVPFPDNHSLEPLFNPNLQVLYTYRENNRNTPSDSLASISLRLFANPQLLPALRILPADDGSSEQEDLEALSRRKHGRHTVVGVRDCYLCLWGEAWRRRERGGFLWTVDHLDGRNGLWPHGGSDCILRLREEQKGEIEVVVERRGKKTSSCSQEQCEIFVSNERGRNGGREERKGIECGGVDVPVGC
jgi:hypothetical protein